ncbi:aspartyl-phosphate phosphatase Spo0E family protein [Domibacillus indicus]|uniref:aspartyl-phosphate phosphatase Spo0E family protein n=1 Tax=Domibacillus indicus TaxID=1437523 RepID=UPI0009E33B6A|nr:aspartyl-phosphate phosphatase Spo0E family protein [Domibacillus indicus]
MTYAQDTFCDLLDRIEQIRQLMITSGLQYGLSSPETVRYSEQLDELILWYQLQC